MSCRWTVLLAGLSADSGQLLHRFKTLLLPARLIHGLNHYEPQTSFVLSGPTIFFLHQFVSEMCHSLRNLRFLLSIGRGIRISTTRWRDGRRNWRTKTKLRTGSQAHQDDPRKVQSIFKKTRKRPYHLPWTKLPQTMFRTLKVRILRTLQALPRQNNIPSRQKALLLDWNVLLSDAPEPIANQRVRRCWRVRATNLCQTY